MIEELETVVLTTDLDEYGLKAGDIGAVVLVHGNSERFEVEFVTLSGGTVAVATLEAAQIRRIHEDEIAHVRKVVA